jgi:hypothetical protein
MFTRIVDSRVVGIRKELGHPAAGSRRKGLERFSNGRGAQSEPEECGRRGRLAGADGPSSLCRTPVHFSLDKREIIG